MGKKNGFSTTTTKKIHFLEFAKIKLDNSTNLIHRFVDIPLFGLINKKYSIKTL